MLIIMFEIKEQVDQNYRQNDKGISQILKFL